MRNVVFNGNSFETFTDWQKVDKKTFNKICKLIEECKRTPYEGTGNPEALKHELSQPVQSKNNTKDNV